MRRAALVSAVVIVVLVSAVALLVCWRRSRESTPKNADLWRCVVQHLSDYRVEIISEKLGQKRSPNDLLIRIIDHDGGVLYSWTGHACTSFTRYGDTLYIADYSLSATGCSIVAFDLRNMEQVWKTALKGVGPVTHSRYSNRVSVETDGSEIIVYGEEDEGKYVEYLDLKTGKTLRHKLFSK